jgi:uncharacterized protein (TIGR03437 family)
MLKALPLLLLAAASIPTWSQTFSFVPVTNNFVSNGPHASGGFTKDQKLDLVQALGDQQIACYPGRGDGTFGPPVITALAAGNRIQVADLNRDGLDDLLTPAGIRLATGDCQFTHIAQPDLQWVDLIEDFDDDGILDLAVRISTDLIAGKTQLRRGHGDGTFDATGPVVDGYLVPARVGDLNGDGHRDTILRQFWPIGQGGRVGNTPFEMRAELGNGQGQFTARSLGLFETLYGSGDFNGDGTIDLLFAAGAYDISVWLGTGDGTFRQAQRYGYDCDTEYAVWGSGLGTFDSSGKTGFLISCDSETGSGIYYVSIGSGNPRRITIPGMSGKNFTVDDWNGDNRLDITAWDRNGAIQILLNVPDLAALPVATSSAANVPLVAPGSLASLYGTFPVRGTVIAPSFAAPPTTLGGLQLRATDPTGHRSFAALLFVSPTQVNFRVPDDLGLGWALLELVNGATVAPVGWMEAKAIAPTLFPTLTGEKLNADGSTTPIPGNPRPWPVPAVFTFYGTGFGGVKAEDIRLLFQKSSLPPLSIQPDPGITGLYLIRVRITSVSPGDGDDLDAYGSAVRMQIGDSFTNWFYSYIY